MSISDLEAQRLLDQIVAANISAARRDGTLVNWTPPREADQQRSSRYTGVFASDHQPQDLMIGPFSVSHAAQSRDELIGHTFTTWSHHLTDRTIAFLFAGDLSALIPTTLDRAIQAVHNLDPQLDAEYLTFGDQSRRIWYTTIETRLNARDWRLRHHYLSADLEPAEILGRLNRQPEEFQAVALIEGKQAAVLNHWQIIETTTSNVVTFPRSLFVSTVARDARRITSAAANDDQPDYLQ